VSHSLQVEISSFVSRLDSNIHLCAVIQFKSTTRMINFLPREYLDSVQLFQGCEEKFLDAVSVLLREVQVMLALQLPSV
jgi:hypothetical protein